MVQPGSDEQDQTRRAGPSGGGSPGPGAEISISDLQTRVSSLLLRAGLNDADAGLVAASLVDAEARNIGSHGVIRTRIYAQRIAAGLIDSSATPDVVHRLPGGAMVDGRNAVGQRAAQVGIDQAIEGCRSAAVYAVGVENSNHCGTLAYFARQAAERGLAALVMSTAPMSMAYHGGGGRAVGTNPLCFAIPCEGRAPIVVDMATSATARGKLIMAAAGGASIPAGLALDPNGNPTTDAAAAVAGTVLPFAGPKGSGLAMAVELLAGAMVAGATGPDFGDLYEEWERPQRLAHFIVTFNPAAWRAEPLGAVVAAFAQRIHGLPAMPGVDQVLLPGEPEDRAHQAAVERGIALPTEIAEDLARLPDEIDGWLRGPREAQR